ncbi:MAG: hypothetical protein AMXMBFR83_07420 [Phycisphaerae bacterium]
MPLNPTNGGASRRRPGVAEWAMIASFALASAAAGDDPCAQDPCAPKCPPCGCPVTYDPCLCPEPVFCDDGDPCTDDCCEDGQCVYLPKDCDDGLGCTLDSCVNGD